MKVYDYKWSGSRNDVPGFGMQYDDATTYLKTRKFLEKYYQDLKFTPMGVREIKAIDGLGAESYNVTDSALIFHYNDEDYAFRKHELAELIGELQKIHDSLIETGDLETND